MASNEGRCRSWWKQWLVGLTMMLLMATGVGTLDFSVSYYIRALEQWKDVPLQQKEFAVLFPIVGCVIGAVLGAATADVFGRKWSFLGTLLGVVVAILELSSSADAIIGHVITFISGFNAGITCTVVPLYISEIADDQIRGSLLMLPLLGIYIGQFLTRCFQAGLLIVYIGSAIIPIASVITISFLPETPYHLASKKQYERAASSLAFFRGIDQSAAREEIEIVINSMKETCGRRGTCQRFSELFRGKNQRGLVILSLLIIAQWNRTCFNSSEDLAYALQDIMEVSLSCALLIMSATLLIWSGFLVFTIDRFGRRLYLLGSTLVGLVIATFATALIMDRSYIFFFSTFILRLCQVVIYGVILVYVGELFSPNVRSIGSAMMVIFATLCQTIFVGITWAEPELTVDDFHVFIPIYLLAFVLILVFVPETKKHTFTKIQNSLVDYRFKCRRTTS